MEGEQLRNALNALRVAVDEAAGQAIRAGLPHGDVADELRRLAQGWQDAA